MFCRDAKNGWLMVFCLVATAPGQPGLQGWCTHYPIAPPSPKQRKIFWRTGKPESSKTIPISAAMKRTRWRQRQEWRSPLFVHRVLSGLLLLILKHSCGAQAHCIRCPKNRTLRWSLPQNNYSTLLWRQNAVSLVCATVVISVLRYGDSVLQ